MPGLIPTHAQWEFYTNISYLLNSLLILASVAGKHKFPTQTGNNSLLEKREHVK